MPDLTFEVVNAEAVPFAAAPMIALNLGVTNAPAEQCVHTVVLRCQVQIEATRRRYDSSAQGKLNDLFGQPARWGETMRSLLWTNAAIVVPSFAGSTLVGLQVPCSFDLNVAATKYFYALDEGEVPLLLMFSGTVFYDAGDGRLQVAPIPWSKEVRFRLPVRVWKEMMDLYYPNSAWLCLHRDAFDRLYSFRAEHGITSWEETLERLLASQEEPVV